MKILIAGASGAVGRSLIPKLVERGHTVAGTTRTPAKMDELRALGAQPVPMDGLDRESVFAAVERERPDVVMHQMTALSGLGDMRKFEKAFAPTNRLRTEGTNHLLEAARANGVERVIAQSFAGWPFARTGGPVKTEDDPLDADPPKQLRTILEAIRHLESAVTGAGGVVLRYGGFYGPGTGMTPGAEQWEMVKARKLPVVGDGGGVWSFLHIEDAAAAAVAAVEHWTPGEIYNVCDDDPAPVREWLPALAEAIGAPPPRRMPKWLLKAVAPHFAVLMCEARGASNAKAKRALDWSPTRASWRQGFRQLAAGT